MAISVVSTAGGVTRMGSAAIAKLGRNAQRHFSPARVSAAGGKSTKAGISVPASNVRHIRGCKLAVALLKMSKSGGSGDAVNTEALRARTVPCATCYSAADFSAPSKAKAKAPARKASARKARKAPARKASARK